MELIPIGTRVQLKGHTDLRNLGRGYVIGYSGMGGKKRYHDVVHDARPDKRSSWLSSLLEPISAIDALAEVADPPNLGFKFVKRRHTLCVLVDDTLYEITTAFRAALEVEAKGGAFHAHGYRACSDRAYEFEEAHTLAGALPLMSAMVRGLIAMPSPEVWP